MAEQDKQPAPSAKPGQVITPGGSQAAPSQPAHQPRPAAAEPADDIPEDRKQLYKVSFSNDGQPADATPAADVSWTASEFVAHEKSVGWYGGLALVAAVIAAAVYLVTRDVISTSVVVVCAGAFGTLAGKKPRQLQYHLDGSGISVGSRQYTYEMFRSFSVVPEGAFSSIVFMPLKRFAPLTTIYYAPEDEAKIITILTKRLPVEEHKDAVIDSLMKRVRF
jgi:hypothetical protein